MQAIGYSSATAWIFPAIIDTAVAVSTLMLVALGDKPARRGRSAITAASTQNPGMQRAARNEKPQATRVRSAQSACTDGASRPRNGFASVQLGATQTVRSARAGVAQDDADLASDLIASGVTTQSVDTVIAVLSAHRDGASINAAAKVAGINYRTAQRIVEAATVRRQLQFAAVG